MQDDIAGYKNKQRLLHFYQAYANYFQDYLSEQILHPGYAKLHNQLLFLHQQ